MRHKLQVTTAISQLLLSDESNLLEHFCITKINTHLQQLACTLGCTFHTVVPTLIYQWSALTFLHFIVSWYIDSISPHQQSVTSVFNSLKQTKQFFLAISKTLLNALLVLWRPKRPQLYSDCFCEVWSRAFLAADRLLLSPKPKLMHLPSGLCHHTSWPGWHNRTVHIPLVHIWDIANV